MRAVSFVAFAAALLAASAARAQDLTWTTTVVGFSADGKVALLRTQERMEGQADAIAVGRLDLEKKKLLRRHEILGREEIGKWHEAHPDASAEDGAKALAKLRGQRWTELEKQLKKEGFKVDPQYPAAGRDGGEGHGRHDLGSGLALADECTASEESGESCDLVLRRGQKRAVVAAKVYEQQPSRMYMNYVERVYLDPRRRHVLAIDRWAPLGGTGHEEDPERGLRVFELATLAKALE